MEENIIKKQLKVVHFSNFAPKRSGLYECTKEMIKYERKHGIDAYMSIMETENPPDLMVDGDFRPISWEASKDADILVLHRGIPQPLLNLKKPMVTVIHGTVEYLMFEEINSAAEKAAFNTHINLIKETDAVVAVNQHDFSIYKHYDPLNQMVMIHDAVDMEVFTIDGYQYPYNYHPQILCCDSLRINKYPAHAIWAMPKVIEKLPTAKLSIVGLDLLGILTWRNILLRSPGQHLMNNIENIQLSTNDIIPYMRGADILINTNMSGIPSRVELEAMSCGCQVISYGGNFTKWVCKPYDIDDMADKIIECWEYIQKDSAAAREESRQWVFEHANIEKQVDQYIELYTKILNKKR
jgi:glycosyltransferase involved in cell wall biosynthesis